MANISDAYILITIAVLALLVIVLIVAGKQMKSPPTRWAYLAFLLIVAGIVFGENRLIGYGLMGAGILFACIDIFVRDRNQGKIQ